MDIAADGPEATATRQPAVEGAMLSAMAAVLAGLASGRSGLDHVQAGGDFDAAIEAMTALGARIERSGEGWSVWGTGNGCLLQARGPLDFAGAETAATLVAGLVGTYDMETVLGGASLAARDRAVLLGALAGMGAQTAEAGGQRLRGARFPAPIQVDGSEAGHAVAAAILLAGLNAPGITSVTVRPDFPAAVPALLRRFGVTVLEADAPTGRTLAVTGQTMVIGAPLDLARLAAATVIAIDGPAGGGKGTLARRVADYYHLNHLDTGLTYRAVAQALLAEGRSLEDVAAAEAAARAVDLAHLDRKQLAAHAVGEAASRVAIIAPVRRILVDKQRAFAAVPPGAVLDGRDIGTVVCPDATIKLYVTARAEVRAGRRLAEIEAHGGSADLAQILADIRRRDERDMGRADSPLRPAADAHLLDTSEMDIEAAFRAARDIIDHALAAGKRD